MSINSYCLNISKGTRFAYIQCNKFVLFYASESKWQRPELQIIIFWVIKPSSAQWKTVIYISCNSLRCYVMPKSRPPMYVYIIHKKRFPQEHFERDGRKYLYISQEMRDYAIREYFIWWNYGANIVCIMYVALRMNECTRSSPVVDMMRKCIKLIIITIIKKGERNYTDPPNLVSAICRQKSFKIFVYYCWCTKSMFSPKIYFIF